MKKNIIPPISKEVKKEFLAEVLLSPEDIQQSVELDKTFQHDALQKLVLKGFIEWLRSPCIEHGHGEHSKITHEICARCRRIAWESLK
jgi:predicted transcriptional regulator